MKTLISMVAFVLQQMMLLANKECSKDYCLTTMLKYAEFLSKPLTLGMFVPCDEKGNVLEEPTAWDFMSPVTKKEANLKSSAYKEAKERILFEGFVFHYDFPGVTFVKNHIGFLAFSKIGSKSKFNDTIVEKVEDLVKYNLELTPTAIKEIGL